MLPELTKVSIGYDYIKMILHYILTSIDKTDKIELEKMLVNTLNQEKEVELMTSLAQSWKEEAIEIGILDGIKISKAEGEYNKAIAIAKKMLAKNHSISDMSDITGLSAVKIEVLKA